MHKNMTEFISVGQLLLSMGPAMKRGYIPSETPGGKNGFPFAGGYQL